MGDRTDEEIGKLYWENYTSSPINENAVLIVYGITMWLKCFTQLKLVRITARVFTMAEKLFRAMIAYAVFYFAVLFLFAVVGFVLFYDLYEFSNL